MKLVVITHAKHILVNGKLYAYAPYVKEMNLWTKHVSECTIVAPLHKGVVSTIDMLYSMENVKLKPVPGFSLVSLSQVVISIFVVPYLFFKILKAMDAADHIHVRCPGNMGLLGCIAQLFFPKKPKTAKYAGNWDPSAPQPWSYRLQKWILSNTFLTKNMQVLVYGDWPSQSKNIKPFFTASYPESKILEATPKIIAAPYRFLFVGTLARGKRPLYAIQLVEKLVLNGIASRLDLYGEGAERIVLERYIAENSLDEVITLHGNQPAEVIEDAYQKSDFLLLPSQSEGWPKVVAEAMFWGVIPSVTKISCVPWMLGQGSRGLFLSLDVDQDKQSIAQVLKDHIVLSRMSREGQAWAQQYTLDSFETAIKNLLE